MSRRLLWTAIVALVIVAVGCSKVPRGIIKPDKMSALMADMAMAESVVESEAHEYANDSSRRILRRSVYAAHGVTQADVDTSLVWYGQHIELYAEVCGKSVELLEQRSAQSQLGGEEVASDNKIDGDSIDLWEGSTSRRIATATGVAVVPFRIARDRNWEKGDIFQLRFKTTQPGKKLKINATLVAGYSTDRWLDYNDKTTSQPWTTIEVKLDSLTTASQVYGSIVVGLDKANADQVVYIDSISLVKLHWKPSRRHLGSGQKRVSTR